MLHPTQLLSPHSPPQRRRAGFSGFQPLHQHQPQHQHQDGAHLATPGPRDALWLPAAATAPPGDGPLTRGQPEQLQQLLRRQRPGGPPRRLPLAPGAGQAPRRRGQGQPLWEADADGRLGHLEWPDWHGGAALPARRLSGAHTYISLHVCMYVGVRVRGGWACQAGASPTRSVSVCGPRSHWRQSPEPQGPVWAENGPPPGAFSHASWPLFVRLRGDPSCFRETLWETAVEAGTESNTVHKTSWR